MKLTLTDEQVSELVKDEVDRKVLATKNYYIKEISKVQQQLQQALKVVDDLLFGVEAEPIVVKAEGKAKLTDEQWIELFNSGKTNVAIAKETGYNPSYLSGKKKKLIK